MSILTDLVAEHTVLEPDDVEHLTQLVGEWQLVSDLSFADLLLWVQTADGDLLCVAQVRPTTGSTAYQHDQVGHRQSVEASFELGVALREGRICREADPDWTGSAPVRREAIPVRRAGTVIGLLARDTNLTAARSPSALELAYLQGAAELCQMIAEGAFPPPEVDREAHAGPRVGDGLVRLRPDGTVAYASPNGLSAYRRMGVPTDLLGARLASLTAKLASDPFDGEEIAERIEAALAGDAPPRMEIEADGATVLLRAMPVVVGGEHKGALVLVRDVTDVRRRDRQLMSKDATIREIHHRVKNNLQTVAALLRLQARRVGAVEARAALHESVRRVSSIALVHETLAQSLDERVDFDGIVDRLLGMVAEVAAPESAVRLRREGEFGELPAELATPLVMVLTELMQNAVEHAFTGPVRGDVAVVARRTNRAITIVVRDDGAGLPDGFDIESSDRLGLQIVRTLVRSELRGTIDVHDVHPQAERPRGTEAVVVIPLVHRPLAGGGDNDGGAR